MGNEGSSHAGRPPTILVIEALLWPTTSVVFCRVFLRERDSDEDQLLGEVKQFPGQPLAVMPRHISSILVVSFHAANGASAAELASFCVPISSLVQFGAPLFTSLWLGLEEGRMGTKFDSALKYAKSAKSPKVRIGFFRPSFKSFKELELKRDEDSLNGITKSRSEEDAKGTLAEPDIFAALATDFEPSGLVSRDAGPSLAQQILGIMKGLRASNELVWVLQSTLFAQQNTAKLMQDAAQVQETQNKVWARIRVTISEYRGLKDMCCVCEVPGYADLKFKMWHNGSAGTSPLTGAGSNLAVGTYDYAECEAYPVGLPLRFAGRLLGARSDQEEEPFAWGDLESDAFYPDGYRGDLMLLDANGHAKGTVNVRVDVVPDEPDQCEGEIPFNDATCQFEPAAASAELAVMLAREGLDVVIDRINEVMIGDFATKWGKSQNLISTLLPAKEKIDTMMILLPLPTPVKIDQSKDSEGASQEERQKDWARVVSDLVEYLTILNSMLQSSGINLQVCATQQKTACIMVKWQPKRLAASQSKHGDGDGETDSKFLHQRIEEQQQVFSEEIMKVRRQYTESVLTSSRNLSTVRDEFLQQNSELKAVNERLQTELETLRNKQVAASTMEQAAHVQRSLDQAAYLEAALNREKVQQQRSALLEKTQAELEEKHSQYKTTIESNRVTIESLNSLSSQQAAIIEDLRSWKESAQKEAAERELTLAEMKKAIAQAATNESLLLQRITDLQPSDRDVSKVQHLEAALAESMSREESLRQTLDKVDEREAESLQRVHSANAESSQAFQTALQDAVAKEAALLQSLEHSTQREAALKEQCRQAQEEASRAAARLPELEVVLSDAMQRETILKEALDQAKRREAELLERIGNSSEETSKTWQVALREAAERESALREAVEQAARREAASVQRDTALKAALDEAGKRENAWREALEKSAEREATETANLKKVALQEVTTALREVEEKDAMLQEVLAKHAALEVRLETEQSLKETALKDKDATLGETTKKETELILALREKELQLEQALKRETAILGNLVQREEQVVAREASLNAALSAQKYLDNSSNSNHKQMAEEALREVAKLQDELATEKAAALLHKQAAVSSTEETAIKEEQFKEATKETAYLKEVIQREAALKDLVLEDVAAKERELKEAEDKWKELQRQVQGSQKELQQSREAQFQLEEQLVATEAQQAKLRAELQVKQDIESQKEELLAKVLALETEVARTKAGLQAKATEPLPSNLQAELEALKEQLEEERAARHNELLNSHREEIWQFQRKQDEAIQLLERRSLYLIRLKSRFAEALRLQSKGQIDQHSQQIIAQLKAGMDDCEEAISEPMTSAKLSEAMMSAKQGEDELITQRVEGPSDQGLSIATQGLSIVTQEPEMQPTAFSLPASVGASAASPPVSRVIPPSQQMLPWGMSPQRSVPASHASLSPQPQPPTLQLRTSSPMRVSPPPPIVIQGVQRAKGASISGYASPPAVFDCSRRVSPPRTQVTPPMPQSPMYPPQSRTSVTPPVSTGSTPSRSVTPSLKKATVRCTKCSALNMIKLEGPPTIQCGGCGFEFQVDPNVRGRS